MDENTVNEWQLKKLKNVNYKKYGYNIMKVKYLMPKNFRYKNVHKISK